MSAPDRIFIDEDGDACLAPSGRPANLVALPACNDVGDLLNPDAWAKMVKAHNVYDEMRDMIEKHARWADGILGADKDVRGLAITMRDEMREMLERMEL